MGSPCCHLDGSSPPPDVRDLTCKPLAGCERHVGVCPKEVEGQRVSAPFCPRRRRGWPLYG